MMPLFFLKAMAGSGGVGFVGQVVRAKQLDRRAKPSYPDGNKRH